LNHTDKREKPPTVPVCEYAAHGNWLLLVVGAPCGTPHSGRSQVGARAGYSTSFIEAHPA